MTTARPRVSDGCEGDTGWEFTKVGPRPRVYDVGARGCGDLPGPGEEVLLF
jgi:hypothetical protein